MDLKGKGKAGYKRVPKDATGSPGSDYELSTLQGSTSSFPTRYLKDDIRLDGERDGEDPDEQGVLYHEKQWPAHQRVWRKQWCEWRLMLLIALGSLVFAVFILAVTSTPKNNPSESAKPIPVHPITFGQNLGCVAPHFFHDSRNDANSMGNTTIVNIDLPGSDFTVTMVGQTASGTITLFWDRTLAASRAELKFSIASQNPGSFDFTTNAAIGSVQYDEPRPGFYLEVVDDPTNCVVFNISLRLPWELRTLSLDMRSAGQVRFLPTSTSLDDGSAPPTAPHILQELNASFTSNPVGSVLLLSEGFKAEKATISMGLGELTGSWPMPKELSMTIGPAVDVGAGMEFFPFDG